MAMHRMAGAALVPAAPLAEFRHRAPTTKACRRSPSARPSHTGTRPAERRQPSSVHVALRCNVLVQTRRLHNRVKIVKMLRDARRRLPARLPESLAGRSTWTVVAAAGVLAATALVNRQLARRAERRHRPIGKFVRVDGIRLHYLERGHGDPLVLLHGNGSMIEDFETSGLIDLAAKKHRVIVFDRPGYGHSERPRGTIWTPEAQADLLHRAMAKIGVPRATVLGHSWGASVAIALALKYPKAVTGLVLASGYYYPSVRGDVLVLSQPAIPVIGDIIRYTIAPLASRLLWPLAMRKIFGPAAVPKKFEGFPKEMAVRPSQLRASAAEAFLMIPDAIALQDRYADLRMPVVIIAGDQDRLVDIDRQSRRLHRQISQSAFRRVRGAGHMVHQTATSDVMGAIDQVTRAAA
jgi:pimeloyl-ACP methyl ester carboxylesterase